MTRSFAALLTIGLLSLIMINAPASAAEIKAGPIWNDVDAGIKCPIACQSNSRQWTGQWRTTKPGKMSICECTNSGRSKHGGDKRHQNRRISINTGPIWNNNDAQRQCPNVCGAERGYQWDGNWRTTQPGRSSQCDCVRR